MFNFSPSDLHFLSKDVYLVEGDIEDLEEERKGTGHHGRRQRHQEINIAGGHLSKCATHCSLAALDNM